MAGNPWTTLTPAPARGVTSLICTETAPGEGIGYILFDTYMDDSFSPNQILIAEIGTITSTIRWIRDIQGVYGIAFTYEEPHPLSLRIRVVAANCKNIGVGGGRPLDGNRITPSKDDIIFSR